MNRMMVVVGLALAAALSGCVDADIRKARKEVMARMHDEDSAKFRNERVLFLRDGKKIVCGEVNGKNRLGAYAGFTPYLVESLDVLPWARFGRDAEQEIRTTCSLGTAKGA